MTRRQTASIVFVVLCVVLVAAAVTLNIGWIMVNGRRVAPLVLGVITFALIIAGLIVYTVFLVREMGITEQQDSFLNSVTHELKTPIASIRLYLETLQSRDVGDAQRKEFYRVMLQDADRLQHTVEQVLRAGAARQKRKLEHRAPVDLAGWCRNASTRRARAITSPRTRSRIVDADPTAPLVVDGDVDDLRTAIANLLDNAVKYSSGHAANHRAGRRRHARHGVGPRQGHRRRHPARAARSHLQSLLSLPAARLEGQRHRPRPLHRALDRQAARRPRVCGERRRGKGRDVHARTAASRHA